VVRLLPAGEDGLGDAAPERRPLLGACGTCRLVGVSGVAYSGDWRNSAELRGLLLSVGPLLYAYREGCRVANSGRESTFVLIGGTGDRSRLVLVPFALLDPDAVYFGFASCHCSFLGCETSIKSGS
jgi:hypothetical protein